MGFYKKICTKVISLLCLIDVLTHAADNVTLVNKMCGATFAPEVCISCIKSNSKDALTDVDVIHQMLGCLHKDASKLMNDTDNIINNNSPDLTEIDILKRTQAKEYPAVMAAGALVAQGEVSMRKFNDAKATIREHVYGCLKSMNYILNNFKDRIDSHTITRFNWPPLMFSGVFNVEADYKISDQLLASVKA